MKKTIVLCLAGFVLPLGFPLCAQKETPLESRIESIGLFKNGLGYVKESAMVSAPGRYVMKHVPEPVHGTFWIESEAEVVAYVVSRPTKVPMKDSGGTFSDIFAGRKVTVHFGREGMPPLKGTVCMKDVSKPAGKWSREYEASDRYHGYYGSYSSSRLPETYGNKPMGERFLKMDTGSGVTYLDTSLIAYIESDGENDTAELFRPVLVLDVKKVPSAPSAVSVSYLTKGIAWAPSYRIELAGPDTLEITQKAIVKNEFAKFADSEISLISGFPNVKFANATSPLSPGTDWASFFRQLNRTAMEGNQIMGNVLPQQAVSGRSSGEGDVMDFSPEGETSDIFYNSIGRFSMEDGDAFSVQVASDKAKYEELVEWIVPDTRTPDGRQVQEHEVQRNPEKYQQSAWDAMKFSNPFRFPMTTAPAMICSGGKFLGETVSTWVNPGQETLLHITKALSISTNVSEREVEGKREIVYIGGNDFRKTLAEGELSVRNHRKKDVKMLVKRYFSGDLKSADGNPKCELREEGVYSVNKRNELLWNMTLKPGEEKVLKYQYEVLVNN